MPALQGLGSPTWDASARGALLGLSLSTTRADLARAVVDGILHQVADAAEPMGVAELWVDGGLSRSDWIVQRLADLTGARVRRTTRSDSTALGAATLAGLAAGVWSSPADLPEIPLDLTAEPRLPDAERAGERERWAAARGRRLGPGHLARLPVAALRLRAADRHELEPVAARPRTRARPPAPRATRSHCRSAWTSLSSSTSPEPEMTR